MPCNLYLNREKAKQWDRIQRNQYREAALRQNASAADMQKLLVNAGITPDEAYREMEAKTAIIMNPVGEFATYQRVNAASKAVNLGKLDYTYRQASAQTGGQISLSGQTGIITDAVEYKNAGTVIPIIDHGVKREWREMLTFGADGFDTMVDDSREGTLVALRKANEYLWNGNATIESPDGRVWLGIKNDTSLVQATTALDFSSQATTFKQIVDEIVRLRDLLRITNNCSQLVELAIPRETMSYWETLFSQDYSNGNVSALTFIRGLNGIASVYEDPQLTGGKELLMAYIDLDGLHAVTGQALSSYMDQRFRHNDPYIMVKWMAQGFIAKQSYTGQKCALYCKAA